jgi:hypothetical protein
VIILALFTGVRGRILGSQFVASCIPPVPQGQRTANRCGPALAAERYILWWCIKIRCSLWGEFWWIEGEHRWVFFDDEKTSETYAEQLTHCPDCGRSLERKALRVTTPSFTSLG